MKRVVTHPILTDTDFTFTVRSRNTYVGDGKYKLSYYASVEGKGQSISTDVLKSYEDAENYVAAQYERILSEQPVKEKESVAAQTDDIPF